MATKKKQSTKKKQPTKKLSFGKMSPLKMLLAVLVVGAIAGIGTYTLTTGNAAKGGGKGKPGGTTQFVTSPYGISAVGGTWGPSGVPSTITITDSLTGAPLASLAGVEPLVIILECYQNGTVVGTGSFVPSSVTTSGANYSLKWTSGGADCTTTLQVMRNSVWVATASTTYRVAP